MFNLSRANAPTKLREDSDLAATSNQASTKNSLNASGFTKLSLTTQINAKSASFRNSASLETPALQNNHPELLPNTQEHSKEDDTKPVKQRNLENYDQRPLSIETQSKFENFKDLEPQSSLFKSRSNSNAATKLRMLMAPATNKTIKPTSNYSIRQFSPQKAAYKNRNKSEITPLSPVKVLNSYKSINLPNIDSTRCSNHKTGVIDAYAVNTNKGIIRDYNEDRAAVVINIAKPLNHHHSSQVWPVCSLFGVYDGHGGSKCADFLRDKLHHYITQDKNFPSNCVEALKQRFAQAEKEFTELAQKSRYELDCSGSCAIVVLIVGDDCYVANVGDSRAIMSIEQGKEVVALSRDHKPSDEQEKIRIVSAGGTIYQSNENTIVMGPARVSPGGLSVSRTIGDVEAKCYKYGGIPGVVSAEPEIKSFKINREHDFIVMASDGVYDKLSNEDIVKIIWEYAQANKCPHIHSLTSGCVEAVIKEALLRKTMDNVTIVMIALDGFSRMFFPALEQDVTTVKRSIGSRQLLRRAESISNKAVMSKIVTNTPDRSTLRTPNKSNLTPVIKPSVELLPSRTVSLSNNTIINMKPALFVKGTTNTNSPTRSSKNSLTEITLSGMKFYKPQPSQPLRGSKNAHIEL